MLTRRQIMALERKHRGQLSADFLAAIEAARSRADIEALIAAIPTGDLESIIHASGIRPGSQGWASVLDGVGSAYLAGGIAAVGKGIPRRYGLQFDIRNPRAEAWLGNHAREFVTYMDDQQQRAVSVVLRNGMEQGQNPLDTALDIIGEVGRTGRRQGGVLGLTEEQAEQVIKSGRLSGQKMLRHRAEVVARTETMSAINASNDEALQQAVDEGLAEPDSVTKVWHSALAENTRPGHAAMHGQTVALNEPFVNPDTGARMMHPGDTSLGAGPADTFNCRCIVTHHIDFFAA